MVSLNSGLLMEMANGPYSSMFRDYNTERCAIFSYYYINGVLNVEPDIYAVKDWQE